jgi:16S rRNA (guanine527-N7)-methyltransferase
MHPARIAELIEPFLSPTSTPCHSESGRSPGESLPRGARRREPAVLSATQLQSISTYIDILLHWNARINLTAIRHEEEIVTRHFGESLFAACHLFPKERDREGHDFSRADIVSGKNRASAPEGLAEARSPKAEARAETRVADVGSGAGFPGIPIKLWAPKISLTLIESNQKKATFLREVTRALTLTDVNIQNARAESLPPSSFEVVTLRAVERLSQVLPVAANLLAPSGRLALLIASSQLEAIRSTLPNLAWQPPIPIPQSKSRLLLLGRQEPGM